MRSKVKGRKTNKYNGGILGFSVKEDKIQIQKLRGGGEWVGKGRVGEGRVREGGQGSVVAPYNFKGFFEPSNVLINQAFRIQDIGIYGIQEYLEYRNTGIHEYRNT